ncbi:MAG: hypothetical protein ABI383_11505 [Acidobacteriaceae bacterium]
MNTYLKYVAIYGLCLFAVGVLWEVAAAFVNLLKQRHEHFSAPSAPAQPIFHESSTVAYKASPPTLRTGT